MYCNVYSDDLLLRLVYTFKYTRFWPGVQHIWYYTRIHMICTCCRGQKRTILCIDLYIYILYTRLHFWCKSIGVSAKRKTDPNRLHDESGKTKKNNSDALASMTGSCKESDSFESLQFWVNRSPEEWSWTFSVKCNTVILFERHLIKILGTSFSDELLATIPGNICKTDLYKNRPFKEASTRKTSHPVKWLFFQARTVPPKLPDATDRRTSASQKVLSKHLEQLKNWRKEGKVPSSPVGTPRAIVRPECLVSGWGEVEFWGFQMHFFGDGWFLLL